MCLVYFSNDHMVTRSEIQLLRPCFCGEYLTATSSSTSTCRICEKIFHSKCYRIHVSTNQFTCIYCRIELNDPFYSLKHIVFAPRIFEQVTARRIEFKHPYDTQIQNINSNTEKYVLIICSKLECDKSYIRWPSDNMLVIANGTTINYDPTRHAIMPKPLKFGANSVEIRIDTETLDKFGPPTVVIGIYIAEKVPFEDVATNLLKKCLLPSQQAKQDYINRFQGEIELHAPYSIIDPLTLKMIRIPARGRKCNHLQTFDFQNFLKFNETTKSKRWQCLICSKIILLDDLLVDEFFYSVLYDITVKYQDKYFENNGDSGDVLEKVREKIENELTCIYINREGDWSVGEEFKSNWEKQHPVNKQPKKHEVKPTDDMDIETGSKQNQLLMPTKITELTIEEAIDCFHDIKSGLSNMREPEQILDSIAIKMKEMNIFKNYSPAKMYQFLQQTERAMFSKETIFDIMIDVIADKSLNEFIEQRVYLKYLSATRFIFAWASSTHQLVDIALGIASQGKRKDIDIMQAFELMLALAYHMQKKLIPLDLPEYKIAFVFGSLINLTLRKMSCYSLEYLCFFMDLMRKCLPCFYIPKYIGKNNVSDLIKEIELVSEFVARLVYNLQNDEIAEFFAKVYMYPKTVVGREFEIQANILLLLFKLVILKVLHNPQTQDYQGLLALFDKNCGLQAYCSERGYLLELLDFSIIKPMN